MDTTTTPPTPPAPPAPPAPPTAAWWQRPLADLLDVTLVAVVGIVVGGAVAAALLAGGDDDPWAALAIALLGLGAGVVAALAAWVGLLVLAARRRTSPGSRMVGLTATRVLPAAGRHLAVVVVLWAGLGTAAAATEPWPAGPLGGALGAAVVTGAAAAAWGRGPWQVRLRIVGIAAVVGLLLTGAVPDRAPYPWELRSEAEAAVRAALVDDPAARRACDVAVGGAGPGSVASVVLASHATEACYDPDREWLVDRHPAVVTEQLAAVVADVVGPHASVRLIDGAGGREVQVDARAVATVVSRRDGCASLVVLGSWTPTATPTADETCR